MMNWIKNNWLVLVMIIVIVFFTFFFRNVVDYTSAVDGSEGFKEFIIAILSVGLISLFTITTLIVQNKTEVQKHETAQVFNDKLRLFKSIIDQFSKIKNNFSIDSTDLHEAHITMYKIQLLGNESIYLEYENYLKELNSIYKSSGEQLTDDEMNKLIYAFDDLVNDLSDNLGLSKIELSEQKSLNKKQIASDIAIKIKDGKYKDVAELNQAKIAQNINPEVSEKMSEIVGLINDLGEGFHVAFNDQVEVFYNNIKIGELLYKTNSLECVIWNISDLNQIPDEKQKVTINDFKSNDYYQTQVYVYLYSDLAEINNSLLVNLKGIKELVLSLGI